MDASRFDTLARSLGAPRSRRGLLATLTGTVLTAALGLGGRQAAAARKPAGARCSSNAKCASGTCIKYGRCKTRNGTLTGKCRCACDNDTQCGAGRICRRRACFSEVFARRRLRHLPAVRERRLRLLQHPDGGGGVSLPGGGRLPDRHLHEHCRVPGRLRLRRHQPAHRGSMLRWERADLLGAVRSGVGQGRVDGGGRDGQDAGGHGQPAAGTRPPTSPLCSPDLRQCPRLRLGAAMGRQRP